MKTNITISEANYNDVLRIRHEVMYPDENLDFVKLDNDSKGLHQGVYLADELVTVISIFMGEDRSVQFRKLATVEKHQNKGYASKLMEWILDYGKDVKLRRIWCNARVDSIDFYKKFKFVETENKFSKNGFDYVVMEITASYD